MKVSSANSDDALAGCWGLGWKFLGFWHLGALHPEPWGLGHIKGLGFSSALYWYSVPD